MTFVKRYTASDIDSLRKCTPWPVISMAAPLEMSMPNNDENNVELLVSLLISLKTKTQNKTASILEWGKSSRQDFKGYFDCPSQCFLFSVANHMG